MLSKHAINDGQARRKTVPVRKHGSSKAVRSAKTSRGPKKASWLDPIGNEVHNELRERLAKHFCSYVEDPSKREYLNDCISAHRYIDLCDYGNHNWDSETLVSAAAIRQVLALYQKDIGLDVGFDREENARKKFADANRLCMQSNHIFRSWSEGKFQFTPRVERILHAAQRKISEILGEVPALCDLKLRFGPGSTTTRKKRESHPRYKLGDSLVCNETLLPILTDVLDELPGMVNLATLGTNLAEVTIGDDVQEFVPKNYKEHRIIRKPTLLNGMVAAGIGDYMSLLLRRVGVDLRDQTLNQRMAKLGSTTGWIATIDLSSASDLISRGLVMHLLPDEWFILLDRVRSSHFLDQGERTYSHAFAGMGCGFTFPLETMIFYCLATACAEYVGKTDILCNAYGDDIIIPVEAVSTLFEVFNAVGFKVNSKKSYWVGSFRESCGADFLRGFDIRPVFIDGPFTYQTLFAFHNQLVRKEYYEAAAMCAACIPSHLLLWGPPRGGDGHLHDPFFSDYQRHKCCGAGTEKGSFWGGYIFDTFSIKGRRCYNTAPGDRLLPLYSTYARHRYDLLPPEAYRQNLPVLSSPLDELHKWATDETFISGGDILWKDGETSFTGEDGHRYPLDHFGVVLPGADGVKRISVYTLAR